MNIHKMKYQVIKRDDNLSEKEKLNALNDLLLDLKVQLEVVRQQYFDASTRTPVLQTVAGFTTLSSCIVAAASFITAGFLEKENPAFDPLKYTAIASVSIPVITRIIAAINDSILSIPLPFTKEANLKRELKKIENVIGKIQNDINLVTNNKQIEEQQEPAL